MWETIVNFVTAISIWEALFILVSKVVEVTLGTVRIILVNKGYRKQATLLSFIEILLWVFIASSVLNGIAAAPIKGVIYGIGFSLGIYSGSYIENKLAFGKQLLQVIVKEENKDKIIKILRDNHYGVTAINGEGMKGKITLLYVYVNRKGSEKITELVTEIDKTAFIVSTDVNNLKGGYIKKRKGLLLK